MFFFALFAGWLCFHAWAVRVGWASHNLPGVEFRQAQTAISAYFIQQGHDYSLAYPTPVLGKPWSVPMEFPLYQWTAVAVSNLTGLNLTQAGRSVSAACFYLSLPAIFVLLGRLGVAVARRWLVLAMVVTCPLHLFYARAFLIETMALMFGLWFWVGFEEAVERRSWRWLLVAMLAGSGAGLVKVTTLLVYLLPAGWSAGQRFWQGRRCERRWLGDLLWMGAAVALPCVLALWWLHFADAVKALNPSAQFLREENMRDWNWGTWSIRLSPQWWRQIGVTIAQQLSWWPVLAVAGFGALLDVGRRAKIFELSLCFSAVPLLFPVLYARHEYYFLANGVLLMMALGLVLVGLAERGRPLWLVLLAALAMTGAQAYRYVDYFYPSQKNVSEGGDGLTRSLRGLTGPDEVLLITGNDWNSMIPYYAERRALMIRENAELDKTQLDAAFAALQGEKIGALVLGPATKGRAELIRRAVASGIDPQPLYQCRDMAVHLPRARQSEEILNILNTRYEGLTWGKQVELPVNNIADAWIETGRLPLYQRRIFSTMRPEPARFFSTFGPVLDGSGAVARFGAHPVTRLVFKLPAGTHRLKTSALFTPEAYDRNLPNDQATDGVQITLKRLGGDANDLVLFSRLLAPRENTGDRGWVPLEVTFSLAQPAEIELSIGPGPQDSNTRDWIWLGPLVIE